MKCPLCGYDFHEADAEASCQGCLMARGCHMVKCPNCGYDVLKEPKLLKTLKAWRRKDNGN
jgi:hypothetical protein